MNETSAHASFILDFIGKDNEFKDGIHPLSYQELYLNISHSVEEPRSDITSRDL